MAAFISRLPSFWGLYPKGKTGLRKVNEGWAADKMIFFFWQ
jgi:hypothetical protein